MKIALCFSGQPRTWEKCYPSWIKFIKLLESKYDAKVDTFVHAWDFNSDSTCIVDAGFSDGSTPISEDEQKKLINILQPKTCIFENELKSTDTKEQIKELSIKHENMYGTSIFEWIASPFYSMMHVAYQKKKYEFDNDFKYDICFRMRFDLFFDDNELGVFFQKTPWIEFEPPVYNTCYSCHTDAYPEFPFMRMGDIFFFADSVTFDRICDFYRWLPIMGETIFTHREVLVEQAFCFYIKMCRVNVKRLFVDPKICRHENYKNQLTLLGRELGRNDIIR